MDTSLPPAVNSGVSLLESSGVNAGAGINVIYH
jgi:hypothetical protein